AHRGRAAGADGPPARLAARRARAVAAVGVLGRRGGAAGGLGAAVADAVPAHRDPLGDGVPRPALRPADLGRRAAARPGRHVAAIGLVDALLLDLYETLVW